MEKKILFRFLLLSVTAGLFFSSCKKDDDVVPKDDFAPTENLSVQDPEGTIVLNMLSGADGNYYKIGELGEIHVDAANNFRGNDKSSYKIEFATIGRVDGLGKVNNIPQSGWAESAAVVPGTGYMMCVHGNGETQYARIYVVDYLTTSSTDEFGNTTSSNSGATIKIQAPLQQTISLESKSLVFSNEGGRQCVNLKYSTHLNIKKCPEWCLVQSFYMDSVVVFVQSNVGEARKGKIVLSNLIGDETIDVEQEAVKPIKLEKTSLTFTSDVATKGIKIMQPTSVSVEEKPDWCDVTTTKDSLFVTVLENLTSQRKGKISLKNAVSSASIDIIQKASSTPLFEKGLGTEADPYQIKTAEQLENINKALGSHFVLTADIDLKSYLYEYGNGWEPLATFKGTLDGKGHTIKGLWMKRPSTDNIGLFISMSGATVSNLKVEIDEIGITGKSYVGAIAGTSTNSSFYNCSINGNITGKNGGYVGGLCGELDGGTIQSCSVSGTITGANKYVGGVCGYFKSGTIELCSVSGTITGNNGYVGGLCGSFSGTSIEECSVSGTVKGNGGYVGGLCGATNSNMTIQKCKTEGEISNPSRSSYVAGIVGCNEGNDYEGYLEGYYGGKTCIIRNCYSVASLSGYYCYGISHNATPIQCYFAGAVSTAYGFGCWGTYTYFDSTVSGRGGGLPTEDMMKQATYESWDFKTVWKITEGKTYPTLRCFDK